MKHLFLLIAAMLLGISAMEAQTQSPKNLYLNFGYVFSNMKDKPSGFSSSSKYGAFVNVGKTFYINQEPISDMIFFGIDWTFFDLNFTSYSDKYMFEDYKFEDKVKYYKAEAGMHVGPSMTITPVEELDLSIYFRYAPSYSAIYDDYSEEYRSAYGSFFVTGLSAYYKVITLGFEYRFGKSRFNIKDEEDFTGAFTYKQKLKNNGPRIYLGVKF